MNNWFLKKSLFWLLLSIFLAVVSCQPSRRNLIKNPEIEGDSSDNLPVKPTKSILNVKSLPYDFYSNLYEEVDQRTGTIVFQLIQGNISDLSIDLDNVSKQSQEWIIKNNTCLNKLTQGSQCQLELSFYPKKTHANKVFLKYSYKDTLNQTIYNQTMIVLNQSIKSLLNETLQTNIDEKYLSSAEFSLLQNSSFVWLTDNSFDSSLLKYDWNTKKIFNMASHVKNDSYNTQFINNVIFYLDMINNSKLYLFSLVNNSSVLVTDTSSFSGLATDQINTYISDDLGSIYFLNSENGKADFKINVGNYQWTNDLITADSSNTKNLQKIYGVFSDFKRTNHYLCEVSFSNSVALPLECSFSIAALSNVKKILANKRSIFILNNDSKFHVFKFLENNLQNPLFTQDIDADNVLFWSLDSANNVLYLLTQKNLVYTLYALDTNTGAMGSFNSFPATETLSNLYLTTGVNTDNQEIPSKVLTVSSAGKIYAFQVARDETSRQFNLNQFIFNDGNNYYTLPVSAGAAVYPKIVNIFNKNLLIPTYDQNIQKNYQFKLDW